ncbi:MAG: prevent-host-death protein [Saprospiraceae bacterium]|nr:prevent-host-death protein [Saprospiraceae bacterium]
MTKMTVGDFKATFSDMLKRVQQGESIAITFGRKKEILAYLIPKQNMPSPSPRPLGLLEGKAGFLIKENFKMTEEEMFS